jgi:galactose mutarotase-like enzyme
MSRSAPPSGKQFALSLGAQTAVVTEVGGGLRSYRVGDRELLDGYAIDQPCTGARGHTFLPWPNRIADGRYRFAGVEHQLPLTYRLGATGLAVEMHATNVGAEPCPCATGAHPYLAAAGGPVDELFTGDTLPDEGRRRRGLGVEPMTAAPDAFNSGDGLVVLEPGQAHTARREPRPGLS